MTFTHWSRVGGAGLCLAGLLFSTALHGAPWLSPGDARARHGVQKLADRGHMDRGVTTWPVMWSSVETGLDKRSASQDSASVGMAGAYLDFEQQAQASYGFRGGLSLAGTTDPAFARGFAGTPREKGSAGAHLEWQGKALAARLQASYAPDPEDDDHFRLDGSYLAGTAGNWVLGAGAIDRWWGPGWQSSLILSNNARPVPAVWINRRDAHAPETPWLSWIGPWQFVLYAGQLEDERKVPEAKLVGMRLSFRPFAGLDIGLSRSIMFGGEDRPESASVFYEAFIGRDNAQNGKENDPGNQLGSIDVRYGFPIGGQSMSFYAQMLGEDEAGAFPAKKSWLLGTDWTTQIGQSDQQWYAEYINTLADDLTGGTEPNVTYEHSIYNTGYRYRGRTPGASLEGDAEAVTLGTYNFFADGRNLGLSLTLAELNKDGITRAVVTDDEVFFNVPTENQTVAITNIRYGTPLALGWLDLNVRFNNRNIQLIGGERDRWSLGAQWRYRF